MDTAAHAALDGAHLRHPFTQQRGWAQEPPLLIERAGGLHALRHRRQRVSRRPLGDVVVLMPPLAIAAGELAGLVRTTGGRDRRGGRQRRGAGRLTGVAVVTAA